MNGAQFFCAGVEIVESPLRCFWPDCDIDAIDNKLSVDSLAIGLAEDRILFAPKLEILRTAVSELKLGIVSVFEGKIGLGAEDPKR